MVACMNTGAGGKERAPAEGAGGVLGQPLVQAFAAQHVAAGHAAVAEDDELLAHRALEVVLHLVLEAAAAARMRWPCCCCCYLVIVRGQVHIRLLRGLRCACCCPLALARAALSKWWSMFSMQGRDDDVLLEGQIGCSCSLTEPVDDGPGRTLR